jgi:hypothetical protein
LVVGLAAGGATAVDTSNIFTAAWTAVCGAGMGMALATAASAALSQLSAERSGVGSALMQAVQKIGVPFGVAILGSILNTGYQSHLDLAGLPAAASQAVKASVFAGVALANQLGSASILTMVRSAFVSGMDMMLVACVVVALVGVLLSSAFLPRRTAAGHHPELKSTQIGQPERKRLALGLLLAVLAREAQQEDADPRLLASLSLELEGGDSLKCLEADRGRVVAREIIEPLSLELILSSLPRREAVGRDGKSAGPVEVVPASVTEPAAAEVASLKKGAL